MDRITAARARSLGPELIFPILSHRLSSVRSILLRGTRSRGSTTGDNRRERVECDRIEFDGNIAEIRAVSHPFDRKMRFSPVQDFLHIVESESRDPII